VIKSFGKCSNVTVCAGNQSGKTILGREITRAFAFDPNRGNESSCVVIIGQDFKALKRNIIFPILLDWGKAISKYDDQDHILYLLNGRKIYFATNQNIESIEGASNMVFGWVDEGSLVNELAYKALTVRAVTCGAPLLVTSTAVPGQGAPWFEELFLKGFDPEFSGDDVPKSERYASHTWTLWDNVKYISERSIRALEKKLSQKEAQVRIYGKFESFGGRVFDAAFLAPKWIGYRRDEIKHFNLLNYMLVDTASGQTQNENGDDTAIVVIGVAPQYGFYVRECIAGLMSVAEIEKTILEKCREYKVRKVGVEHIAAQTNYFQRSINKSLQINDTMRFIPIKHYGGKNNKPARQGRLLTYVETQRFRVPVDEHGRFIKGSQKLIDQMKSTPYGRHDDVIDAASDILAPEMEIITGSMKQTAPPPSDEVKNPLLKKEDFDRLMGNSYVGRYSVEPRF
jgi:predicted phage terminase large subunit-like protein